MALNIVAQTVEVDDVADVEVTTVVEHSGRFARRLRVYGAPYAAGDAPVLDVILRADEADPLKIVVPETSF